MKAVPFFASLALVAVACSPGTESANSLSNQEDTAAFSLARPAIDASELLVTDMQMSHMRVKGVNVGSLYLAASGLSDFVEISTCHSKGCDATRREITNRVVFSPFPNEDITVRARACVEPGRALVTGVLCGTWKEIVWSQPPNVNAALAELLSLREKYRADIEDMGVHVQEALVRFELDIAQCNQRALAAKDVARIRGIVGSVANIGEQLISKALSPGNVGSNGQSAPKGSPTGESLIPNINIGGLLKSAASNAASASGLSAMPGVAAALGNTQKAAAQGSGATVQYDLATTADSVGGLRGLANAVIDIATATEQADALRPCFAKSRADSLTKVAKTRIEEMRAKLENVEAQIKSMGGM